MGGMPRPNPSYLDGMRKLKVVGTRQVWVNSDTTRYFSWDSLHGEIECFNKRGRHLGAMNAVTGEFIKPADHGRTLDV